MKRNLLLGAVIITIFSAGIGLCGDYLAYAVTKKGEFPLPESLDDLAMNAGKHLVNFRWGEYNGPKMRIGVLEPENRSSSASYEGPDGEKGEKGVERVPVGSIDAMIIDSLINTGRFTLVEREASQDLIDEQNLKDTGRTTAATGARSGKMLGARFLIKVVVTHFEPKYKSKNIGLGSVTGGALGGIGVGTQKSMVGLMFRLIDPETGEIVFSKREEVVIGKKGFGVGASKSGRKGARGGSFSSLSATPIGHAVIAAVNCGVYDLVKAIGNQPLKGQIMRLNAGSLMINRGADHVATDDEFRVFSLGEEFVDPETGLSLGSEKEEIGLLRVIKVADRFAYGEAVDFDPEDAARGDEIVSTKTVTDFEFAASWGGPYPKLTKKLNERRAAKAESRE